MLKKIYTSAMLMMLLAPVVAFAQPSITPRENLDIRQVFGIVDKISLFLFQLFIVITVFYVLYAAYLYLKSGGEDEEIKEARNALVFAAIAVAVALFARVLPSLVDSLLR